MNSSFKKPIITHEFLILRAFLGGSPTWGIGGPDICHMSHQLVLVGVVAHIHEGRLSRNPGASHVPRVIQGGYFKKKTIGMGLGIV